MRAWTGRTALVAVLAGGLAWGAAWPASAQDDPAGTSTSGTGDVAAAVTSPGDVRVATDDEGSTISWSPRDLRAYGDARVEFRTQDGLLGVPTSVGAAYVLRVPGRTDVARADVQVTLGGRVLAGPGTGAEAPAATSPLVPPVTALLPQDPGRAGTYATTTWSYRLPSIRLDGLPAKVEMVGQVVAPVGATGRRPVVLFLHGRHTTCYAPGGEELSIDWPCPPALRPIPSHRGYTQTQKLLASQGYVTVSVAANGINGQDGDLLDAGADARAKLVRAHLDVLADWDAGTGAGPAKRTTLKDRLALRKVMTVGHSRGGEGVQRAAIQAQASDRFRIVGQVLVAPTDFGQQVAVGVPTTTLLPYCDGDVSDLQGQMYVDQASRATAGDRATRSAVLVMGANHNYFNSEWTPGVAAAPAWDDWYEPSDKVCGTSAPQRLTAAQQRSVGATYVAAAARTYLTTSTSALPLLDGTPVRAASAGPAVVLSHAVGGRRTALVVPGEVGKVTASGDMTSTLCLGTGGTAANRCGRDYGSPHWSPQAQSWLSEDVQLYRLRWTSAGATARIGVADADLTSRRYLDLRLIAPPQQGTPRVEVVFRDDAGRRLASAPVRQAGVLPLTMAGHLWAQNVRVPFPAGLDRSAIASVTLRALSPRGTVYLLDASAASSGLATSTASVRTVARLDVPESTVLRATTDGTQTGYVVIPVAGTRTVSSRVQVVVIDQSGRSALPEVREVVIRPGQDSVRIPIRFSGDDGYADPDSPFLGYQLAVRAERNAVVDSYAGAVRTLSRTPRPELSVDDAAATAVPGENLSWRLRLTEPSAQEIYLQVRATAPGGGELTLGDLPAGWLTSVGVVGRPEATLSEAGLELMVTIPPYATSALLEIPVRRDVSFSGTRAVALQVVTEPFEPGTIPLTGTVTAP